MDENGVLLKKSLGELIAEQLKKDILIRKIEFGERLIEADIAERFDVSRSTIREALKILEQEELVMNKNRKGTFVSKFTNVDLDEMTELRLMIETKAFIKALDHLDKKHFIELSAIIDEMEIQANNGNWDQLFGLDLQFHQYVINRCGNSRIIKIYESIAVQIRVYMAHLDQYYSSPQSYYKEHKALYEALLQRDAAIVQKQVEQHIKYVEDKLLRNS
ncbi:GntR family transcriptional regulator [Virgibacillus salexigens]|uniref:GntR family transcriptional regulator n=3 Tax=Virgibacillus TaxID=84406 RepID=A0ABQ2DMH3_9BACI|nr:MULTISPECIES: GntR family transcriptional regulator [Virgibacillus]GGJ64325.1 GntR family transcriptional regulator [Virgibacillus kapii]CDQ41689.1 putative HTH-type transcriptional regulator YdfH [Virgibacillus massiliensis]